MAPRGPSPATLRPHAAAAWARVRAAATNRPVPLPSDARPPRVAIIGSGIGGLGMAIRLTQLGVDDVTVFEKASSLGGTWRDNSYPGSGCDVPSHLYSLSFAPNPDWTRRFPAQSEILDHLERTADEFDVRRLIRFDTEIAAADFDDASGTWTLTLGDGSTFEADVVVAATGQLNRPHVPAIEGLDDFAGPAFHSARWDHDVDLDDKDVAVIGIGASAIQFVPSIADRVGRMTLFQRSVNYVAPKPDGPISARTRGLLRRFPVLRRAYRASIWARFESRFVIFGTGFETTGFLEPIAVTGRDGRLLSDEWADGAEAHLGITVAGFPNLFLLYGPNTNLGHNSIIFMIERQIGWILQAVRTLSTGGVRWLDTLPEAQAASNAELDRELARTVWAGDCHSWYKNAKGRITNNWSSWTWRYWQRTRRLDPRDLVLARDGGDPD